MEKNKLKKIMIIFSILVTSIPWIPVSANDYSYEMHTVEKDESYWTISQKYNLSIEKIQDLNEIEANNLIEGQLVAIKTIKNIKIKLNNSYIEYDRQPYMENNRVFAPLRFTAEALNVDKINWIQSTRTAEIIKDNNKIEITVGSDSAKINESTIKLDAPVQIYIDRIYVPLRFFAEALNVDSVDWDQSSFTVLLNSSNLNDKSYTNEDLYWLSRIVNAEAESESYEGKLAVANVILNRKKSIDFPNTIKAVIFDTEHGYQFTPVQNGKIYNIPNEESIKAAKDALDGTNNIKNCMYFINPEIANSYWILYNREYFTRIENHEFYL